MLCSKIIHNELIFTLKDLEKIGAENAYKKITNRTIETKKHYELFMKLVASMKKPHLTKKLCYNGTKRYLIKQR